MNLTDAEKWMRTERDDHGRDYNVEEAVLAELDRLRARPTPAQWAAWFRCCADEAEPWELTDDHRFVFRRVAEHFEDSDIVTQVAGIPGVDS